VRDQLCFRRSFHEGDSEQLDTNVSDANRFKALKQERGGEAAPADQPRPARSASSLFTRWVRIRLTRHSAPCVEAVALVAVYAAEALRAVAIVLKHPALEHVIVVRVVGAAAIGGGHADQRAQAVDEALRVRQLRPARIAPLGDKGVNLVLCGNVPRHGFK